jgi:hypothetical protein
MSLLTAAEFSRLASVSQKTISIALKPKNGREPRLDYCNGSRKIDTNSVKARAFLENVPRQRLTNKIDARNVVPQSVATAPTSEEFEEALTDTQKAQAKKIIEEAELKKQQRIEKELKNAVRRGELIVVKVVDQMIMTWFDRWLHANKRGFNSSFDGFMRDAFKVFENDQNADKKDFKTHSVTRSELKRRWSNLFEEWADDGKRASIKKLKEIQTEQAKG